MNKNSRTVNFCVYCSSKDELSDEHIIPFALSGSYILVNGSCEDCRKITNSFEQPLLRGLFYDYRAYSGLKSRTKLKGFEPIHKRPFA